MIGHNRKQVFCNWSQFKANITPLEVNMAQSVMIENKHRVIGCTCANIIPLKIDIVQLLQLKMSIMQVDAIEREDGKVCPHMVFNLLIDIR